MGNVWKLIRLFQLRLNSLRRCDEPIFISHRNHLFFAIFLEFTELNAVLFLKKRKYPDDKHVVTNVLYYLANKKLWPVRIFHVIQSQICTIHIIMIRFYYDKMSACFMCFQHKIDIVHLMGTSIVKHELKIKIYTGRIQSSEGSLMVVDVCRTRITISRWIHFDWEDIVWKKCIVRRLREFNSN